MSRDILTIIFHLRKACFAAGRALRPDIVVKINAALDGLEETRQFSKQEITEALEQLERLG